MSTLGRRHEVEHARIESQGRTRFALKRYYSLSSLLCTILTAVVLGWSYQHLALGELKSLAESRNVVLTHAFANALWPNFSVLLGRTSPSSLLTAPAQRPTHCARARRTPTSRIWSRST